MSPPESATPVLLDDEVWLAYQGLSSGGSRGVFLVRPDGTADHEIGADVAGGRAHPDFSRDGSRLAYDQWADEESLPQVYVADADGSNPHQVTDSSDCGYGDPAWSPDGAHLAVLAECGADDPSATPRNGIAIVDLDTGKVRTLVTYQPLEGVPHFPRWSADGRQLVFWRNTEDCLDGAAFVVNVDGSGLRQLTPPDLNVGDVDWSPDGSRIVFSTDPL